MVGEPVGASFAFIVAMLGAFLGAMGIGAYVVWASMRGVAASSTQERVEAHIGSSQAHLGTRAERGGALNQPPDLAGLREHGKVAVKKSVHTVRADIVGRQLTPGPAQAPTILGGHPLSTAYSLRSDESLTQSRSVRVGEAHVVSASGRLTYREPGAGSAPRLYGARTRPLLLPGHSPHCYPSPMGGALDWIPICGERLP
jgi:hypothetical protein